LYLCVFLNKKVMHSFHIPVMGLAYTIDTPVKVARFGISSVMSIIEDNLIEKMRGYYYHLKKENYYPISSKEEDYRAKRITDYLNLVQRMVIEQVEQLKSQPFGENLEIDKYFEMLPGSNRLYRIYREMNTTADPQKKERLSQWLRQHIVAGSIDVNIMTKLDRNTKDTNGNVIENGSDAVTALRGYAKSTLSHSSVVLSAGLNLRLFNYMETLSAFDADINGVFNKKIIIKVSDFRSAYVQGKMLAKKGLWVSEFRIESGLNCGGHAFATDGYLIGPILEEFKSKRQELIRELFSLYNQALLTKGKRQLSYAPSIHISIQGGIGTADEDQFLRNHYGVNSTGWGTPFLLVPEATTVDDSTLNLLSRATEQDVFLSKNSPLGIRFHYLKGTSGELEKFERIKKGKPGSPCTEKYLVSNTEFTTEPICTASHTYQKKKLEQLHSLNLPEEEYQKQKKEVLDKECLCIGLSNAAIKKYELKPIKKLEAVDICPGPNIAYFSKIVSLKEMLDHIYGKACLPTDPKRPNMFVKELSLYIDYLVELIENTHKTFDEKAVKYVQNVYRNISNGILYYRELVAGVDFKNELKNRIKNGIDLAEKRLQQEYEMMMPKVEVS